MTHADERNTERTACVLVVDGFEEIEAITVVDVLRRAGVQTSVLGVVHRKVTGNHGITINVDASLGDVIALGSRFDVVVLPGGMPGAAALRDSDVVKGFMLEQRARGAAMAAICAAPIALGRFGILQGRRATCFPGFEGQLDGATVVTDEAVVSDGDVVTSRGPGTAMAFALTLVARLMGDAVATELGKRMLVH